MNLNELAKEAYENSKAKGFWEKEPNRLAEKIALMHSELSEALEEVRANKPPGFIYWKDEREYGLDYVLGQIKEECAADVSRGNAIANDIAYDLIEDFMKKLYEVGYTLKGKSIVGEYTEDTPATVKPEGFPVEVADLIIRCLDVCGRYEIDIERAIRLKMAHNATRSKLHGGKAC